MRGVQIKTADSLIKLTSARGQARGTFTGIAIACALILTAIGQTAFGDGAKVGEIGGWNFKLTASFEDIGGFFSDFRDLLEQGWDAVFSQHPSIQQVYDFNGKFIVGVPVLSSAGGTRLTYNIDFDPAWQSETWVHVIVANVPAGAAPSAMVFQQKYDEDWDEDPDIGPLLRHGDLVRLNPGHGRYMAARSDVKYWNSIILFVEDGILPSQINGLPGSPRISWTKFSPVYVDFGYAGYQNGTPSNPFSKLVDSLLVVAPGGTASVQAGATPERLTISNACTITATAGPVIIGQ